ncbi:hypothetical protein CDAR_73041 [Caerostris darwini]|uniref:Uncharacterized protein n=1 Tax=Caerostris darwini TaxID=1538125 RepID=A0AAV4VQN3_9ARAC|nr:hypothetical protein CDAR_73041 [Caerostris darwini]
MQAGDSLAIVTESVEPAATDVGRCSEGQCISRCLFIWVESAFNGNRRNFEAGADARWGDLIVTQSADRFKVLFLVVASRRRPLFLSACLMRSLGEGGFFMALLHKMRVARFLLRQLPRHQYVY